MKLLNDELWGTLQKAAERQVNVPANQQIWNMHWDMQWHPAWDQVWNQVCNQVSAPVTEQLDGAT